MLLLRTFVICPLLCFISFGCSQNRSLPQADVIKTNKEKNNVENLDSNTEKQIEQLIEQLASKNSPPTGDGWPGLERPDNWDESAQEIVYKAKDSLSDLGKSAFPILLKHLDDQRYSKTGWTAIEYNQSVGDVCSEIIVGNVDLIGMTFKVRTGADGKYHGCPTYFFTLVGSDIEQWWQKNKHKSLKQMQIDVLKWRIKEENKIGFPDEESKESYLTPVLEKLAELEAK